MRQFLSYLLFVFAFIASGVVAQNAQDTTSIKKILEDAANLMKTDTAKAFSSVKSALELSKKINFQTGVRHSYNKLGRLYKQAGKYDEAIEMYNTGLTLCDSLKDWYDISSFTNNLGTVYLYKGDNQKALNFFLKSLKVSEGKVDPIENAPTENNIALIYWQLQQYDKALAYFNTTLETFKQAGDDAAAAGTYSNMGGVYYSMKEQRKSLGYFKLALQSYEKAGDSSGVGIACINIGDMCTEMKLFSEAEGYLKRAYNLLDKASDVSGTMYALLALSNAAIGQDQYQRSEEYLKKALKLAEKMNSINNKEKVYAQLAETYAKMNNYKEAYNNLALYAQLKDTIHKQDAARQIAELDAKYKDEQKNKTIEILKKEKEIADLNKKEEEQAHATQRNYLLASIAVALIIVVLLFGRFRAKQKANKLLEKKNQDIEEQKLLIENKNDELAEKNKEITDGIHYAKRIQMAMLTSDKYISSQVKEHFILYQPKDIVSGDFYWALKVEENFFFAVADCTGHGVPGAFMSMIGINLLNEIIVERKCTNPALVLDILREEVMRNLNNDDEGEENRDGMDMVLMKINTVTKQVDFACANNSLYIYRKSSGALEEFKGDKMPVGRHIELVDSFTKQSVQLNEGDTLYAFSDGFPDQFGGPKGKKFKYKQLEDLLRTNAEKSCKEQKQTLLKYFMDWKGDLHQIDDVCVAAIKV